MKLRVYNRQKALKLPREILKLIEQAAKLCVKRENFAFPCEATITLTDNETIREINRDHREVDKATDVLSFPLLDFVDGHAQIQPGDLDPDTNRVLLGDIIISVEKAQEQAENYGHSFEREMAFLTVHGMLHLLGHDHQTESEEKIMFGKQDAVLEEMGLKRE
jgi:probable rRNA maturation factor